MERELQYLFRLHEVLESRVEELVPIDDPRLRKELRFILDAQLADQRSVWDMLPDGSYRQRTPEPGREKSAQQLQIELAEREYKRATRLRKRRPKGIPGRASGQSEE